MSGIATLPARRRARAASLIALSDYRDKLQQIIVCDTQSSS